MYHMHKQYLINETNRSLLRIYCYLQLTIKRKYRRKRLDNIEIIQVNFH